MSTTRPARCNLTLHILTCHYCPLSTASPLPSSCRQDQRRPNTSSSIRHPHLISLLTSRYHPSPIGPPLHDASPRTHHTRPRRRRARTLRRPRSRAGHGWPASCGAGRLQRDMYGELAVELGIVHSRSHHDETTGPSIFPAPPVDSPKLTPGYLRCRGLRIRILPPRFVFLRRRRDVWRRRGRAW